MSHHLLAGRFTADTFGPLGQQVPFNALNHRGEGTLVGVDISDDGLRADLSFEITDEWLRVFDKTWFTHGSVPSGATIRLDISLTAH